MKITVFCGANPGNDPLYTQRAIELAEWMASRNHDLIFGGGNVGLMGAISNTLLEKGGRVIGVIPSFLIEHEPPSEHLSELRVVETMAQRKQMMLDEADAIIAMPGGPGTMEEITEAISDLKLGLNSSPCVLFNINGYFDDLKNMYDKMVTEGFFRQEDRDALLFSDSIVEIEGFISSYDPPRLRSYR